MKKLIFIFALLLQTVFTFATDPQPKIMRASTDNVNVYRQPSTSTEVVSTLKTDDKVTIVRQHDAKWYIVTINDQVGYVHRSKLKQVRGE